MKRSKSSPKEDTTYRGEASSLHGQENRDSRSEYSDDEQYDMAEANRIEKSRSRTDMDDWTNQLWKPIINLIVTVIVCVLFMHVYLRWGQVQPVSTIDNSHTTKELMTMKDAYRDLRNENEKYKTMLDDISSKLMTIDKAYRRVDSLNEKFGELENNFKTMTGTLEEIRRNIDNYSDKLSENRDEVGYLRSNAFNKSVLMNLVVFLTIAVFALIIGMWIICNRVSFDDQGNTPRHGSGTNLRMSVIEQVSNNPPLTNTICVISYGQTNESFNHTLVHKLMRQLSQPLQDTPVRGHLINTHADSANIPPCKLIFMCVEFSTRHVIIEEQGIGQGDIRRTTYDAVRKLGATLVILYTRDHESRQLGDKLRYQRNIYCVASQPKLKVLDDQKCFYSVFNSFTQFQVESLETVIRRALQ